MNEPPLIQRVDVLRMLLAEVAAVPAGVKLSIPALRDALLSQADVLRGIEALVAALELDRVTLRPPVGRDASAADQPSPHRGSKGPTNPTGEELAAELEQYAMRHGLALSRVSHHLLAGTNALSRLRKRLKPVPKTVTRIRAFVDEPPPPGLEARPRGGPRVADVGGVTGAEVAAKLDALIEQHGLSKSAVGIHLVGQCSGVNTIRHSNPRRKTVARILAFLADPPLDQLKPRDGWATRRANQQKANAAPPPPVVVVGWPAAAPAPVRPTVARSFEDQLERVARGEVGIAPNYKFGRPDPAGTLGGVTGEVNL